MCADHLWGTESGNLAKSYYYLSLMPLESLKPLLIQRTVGAQENPRRSLLVGSGKNAENRANFRRTLPTIECIS
jgi:hypothetical protein